MRWNLGGKGFNGVADQSQYGAGLYGVWRGHVPDCGHPIFLSGRVPILLTPNSEIFECIYEIPPHPSLARLNRPRSQSLSSSEMLQPLNHFVAFAGPSPVAPFLSCSEETRPGYSSPLVPHQGRAEGHNSLLDLLATILLVHLRILLALLAPRAHCQLMVNL